MRVILSLPSGSRRRSIMKLIDNDGAGIRGTEGAKRYDRLSADKGASAASITAVETTIACKELRFNYTP